MGNKKYIVVEAATEYNDEYYEIQDGYTFASKIFSSRESAQEEVKRQVTELFMSNHDKLIPDLFDFGDYSIYDFNYSDLIQYIKQIGERDPDWDEYDTSLPKHATLEECLEAYRISGLDLFKIVELEEDGDQTRVQE